VSINGTSFYDKKSDIKYLPDNAVPYSGTVSHHLLVSGIIDKWFLELKNKRKNIKTFFIVSPKHNEYGESIICISMLDWKLNNEITKINREYSSHLLKHLKIREDRNAFHHEHGIYSLLPFIKKYFPDAQIVPILMDEYKRQNSKSMLLADSISEIVNKDKNTFLIISIDFSHRGDRETTDKRDAISERVLNSLDLNHLSKVYSDNSAGLITLFYFDKNLNLDKNHIFYHTNSAKITGEDDINDITSYFFTFQYH
jgi:hypothetical protein